MTVTERIRALGYEANKTLSWRAGAAIRDKWETATGFLPRKALKKKTSGTGSHCMAVYPATWQQDIDGLIHRIAAEIQAEESRQLSMWG